MDWLKEKLNFIPLVVNGEFLSEQIESDDEPGIPERVFVDAYDWMSGIREKGCVFLDTDLNPCGKVSILHIFGDGRRYEEEKNFGNENIPKYYVSYKFCNDTDTTRYATVRPIK